MIERITKCFALLEGANFKYKSSKTSKMKRDSGDRECRFTQISKK